MFRKKIKQIREWEYWPVHWLYGPIYIVFVWYIIRSGLRFFFTASNPTIKNGGFVLESKKEIYDQLPTGSYPKTLLIEPDQPIQDIVNTIYSNGFRYPFILKPDIGGRGRGVVIIENEDRLKHFYSRIEMTYLVQDYILYPNEVGIFYVRYPDDALGKVTGIVGKGFGTVTGDGTHTVRSLIRQNERLNRQIKTLENQLGEMMNTIPATGETMMLIPFGNHARGSVFYDWSNLISPELTKRINDFMLQIPDFHYGRLDIRFNSWEELLEGKHISIIELNGAGSEPTHIYDPAHSVFFAWKEIIRHWRMLYRVSRMQHQKGIPYMSGKEGMAMLKENAAFEKSLDEQHALITEKG